ncbi:hypothetical protein PHMEG_00018187 [Phytophthora megakarya]|uniref:Uncharacterized protein n=1 Tax=Phytophthora megakarya TaxID=4795 RepID=A0A225VUD6_9STRA|nr:hypothetical protein PHMEG_00018187 [Phytophthora megakarya]
MRSGSCLIPFPSISFPHHFTLCWYKHDFFTLNFNPNSFTRKRNSCNFTKY